MKYIYKISLFISLICCFGVTSLRAMESFDSFHDMTLPEYIARCMPKLPEEKREKAAEIFNSLITDASIPIKEDDSENIRAGEIKKESGFSFPPMMELQGPFLKYCGTGGFKRVLDMGPGAGNDTIPLLLTHNTKVIAIDIHKLQLAELTKRVSLKLSDFPDRIKLFSSVQKDFSDKKTKGAASCSNAIDAVNLSRVAHFLTGSQLKTLVENVVIMMRKGGVLFLTVLSYAPDSRQEKWIAIQEQQGLEDPGLVYYDKHTFLSNDLQEKIEKMELKLVPRDLCELPSPGHKVEFVKRISPDLLEHTIRMGRYFHTPESLDKYLSPYFEVTDQVMFQERKEEKTGDFYLSILAKKK